MFRLISGAIFILVLSSNVFSQTDIDDPDEAGLAMPNVGIMEEEPITDIAEGSGTVNYSGVSIRAKPDINSKVLRTASRSEKVLIIGESGEWLKIRMYNNQEGYINRKYVRMGRIFREESANADSVDKKISFEIEDLIIRFNDTLKKSSFAQKYQIVPTLDLTGAVKTGSTITLSFIYSCIDLEGQMLPSYKKNQLRPHMKRFLELIFAKLMLADADAFRIIINVPNFGTDGRVIDTGRSYAEIRIKRADVPMDEIRTDASNIWRYAESSVPADELFSAFP